MAEDVDAFRGLLRMEALVLLDEDRHAAYGEDGGEQRQGNEEAEDHVANQEGQQATADGDCGPDDVSPSKTQEFKGLLKPLENRVVGIVALDCRHVLALRGRRTEAGPERRQPRRCRLRRSS